MPIYEFQCSLCGRQWEEWLAPADRNFVDCCGKKATLLLSLGTIRPNGVVTEKPKIPKHEPYKTQIIKDGKKTVDQSVPNSVIAETNKVIDKMNVKRGYQLND